MDLNLLDAASAARPADLVERAGRPGLPLQGMTVGHHGGDHRDCGHDRDRALSRSSHRLCGPGRIRAYPLDVRVDVTCRNSTRQYSADVLVWFPS
jgi:hypothetical protein